MLPDKWSEWRITDELGNGSYGTVYQIEKDEDIKAVKIIEIPQKDEYPLIMKEHGQNAQDYCRSIAQDFETEIQTLILLSDCENIIHIEDYIIQKKDDDIGWIIYIFMECYTSFIEYASMNVLSESDVIDIALEITNALKRCEKEGIIHRDIKPENILVTDDGHFLLCDFGLARKLNYKQMATSVKGTYKYMAPEVYHGKEYNASVDIYSLGLILYQCMNKKRGVFLPLDKGTVYYRDQEKALEDRMRNREIIPPCDASEGFADIILHMIAFDPDERYTSAEVLYRDLTLLRNGKYRKKFGLLHYKKQLIALAACLASIAAFFYWFQYPVFQNEPCGKNTVCKLTNGGTLIISGEGDVEYSDPWLTHTLDIKRVIVKDGVKRLGDIGNVSDDLFYGCINLERVDLPDTLVSLGSGTFSDCEKLDKVNIPKSLEECGDNAFLNTKWAKDNLDENGFIIRNGLILDYQGNSEEIFVPDAIEDIGSDIFSNHDEIKIIHFPESLYMIEAHAFTNCFNLETIIGGENVIFVGADAFSDTKFFKNSLWPSLNGILLGYNGKEEETVIPDNIDKLGVYCLAYNPYIRKITIPKNVVMIDAQAFYMNKEIRDIIINAQIESIEPETFYGCNDLETVELPRSLKIIYGHAFAHCVRLKMDVPNSVKISYKDYYGNFLGDPFEGCDAMKTQN